jgi:hypothetical protein
MIKNYRNLNIIGNTDINKNIYLKHIINKIKAYNKNSSHKSNLEIPIYNDQNIGIYTPYTLFNSESTYEYIDELSFIVRNCDRSGGNYNNLFNWRNVLDNKIKNLIFIYIHIVTIPMYPWLNCNTIKINQSITDHLMKLSKHNNLIIDQNIQIDKDIIMIAYYDNEIIDFNINGNFNNLYSLNISNQNVYLYTRSNRTILNEPYIYIDIDSNLGLNNQIYNTNPKKSFSFKIIPITITDNYVYYKGFKQYLIKNLNELLNINMLDIKIFGTNNNILLNIHLNKNLYSSVSNKYYSCNCDYNIHKASCYCNYIRHPYNPQNQIDIGFKIGLIKNEIINNIFH